MPLPRWTRKPSGLHPVRVAVGSGRGQFIPANQHPAMCRLSDKWLAAMEGGWVDLDRGSRRER